MLEKVKCSSWLLGKPNTLYFPLFCPAKLHAGVRRLHEQQHSAGGQAVAPQCAWQSMQETKDAMRSLYAALGGAAWWTPDLAQVRVRPFLFCG